MLRKILFIERGSTCELCSTRQASGLFHILPVGRFPKLQFHPRNVLLACWQPCHFVFHHDYYRARKIVERIKVLRGENYEEDLKVLDKLQPQLTLSHIKDIHLALSLQLKGM